MAALAAAAAASDMVDSVLLDLYIGSFAATVVE